MSLHPPLLLRIDVLCYKAREKRVTHFLMTRFREEHYDTGAHRSWVKIQRSDNARHTVAAEASSLTRGEERRALRSEYFKKKSQGRTAPPAAAQRRLQLDG